MKKIIILVAMFYLCGCGPENYVTGTVIEKFNHGEVGLRILGNDNKEYNIQLVNCRDNTLYAIAISINRGAIISFPKNNSLWNVGINESGIGRVCSNDIIIVKLNNLNIEK